MKRFLISFVVISITIAAIVAVKAKMQIYAGFECSDVEAIASCEISDDKGYVKFACSGDTGTCTISGFGHTLTCSGTKYEY